MRVKCESGLLSTIKFNSICPVPKSRAGFTTWSSAGGDFYTDASSSFTASFDTGIEDLEINITTLVEQWLNSGGQLGI